MRFLNVSIQSSKLLNASANKALCHALKQLFDSSFLLVGSITFFANRKIELFVHFCILRISFFTTNEAMV